MKQYSFLFQVIFGVRIYHLSFFYKGPFKVVVYNLWINIAWKGGEEAGLSQKDSAVYWIEVLCKFLNRRIILQGGPLIV